MKSIKTPRLLIRDFGPEDARDLHEILGDAETMKYCEPAYDFGKTKDFLETFCIRRRGAVAAVEKQSRKLIGYILFSELELGVYELGWFFNRSYWGQGYAFEACKAVMDYAFRELDAQKVFAETIDAVKSVGLMKRLGMTLESIQSGSENCSALYVYGMLRKEWENTSTWN